MEKWEDPIHWEKLQIERQFRAYEDLRRRKPNNYITDLSSCTCPDFKTRKGACKHIYAKAICLGKKLPLTESEYQKIKDKKQLELFYLRTLSSDSNQWGGWNEKVHTIVTQVDRQYRAYEIERDDDQIIDQINKVGTINCYRTSLSRCGCADFEERGFPCKHIYCLALLIGEKLYLSREKFEKQKAQGVIR